MGNSMEKSYDDLVYEDEYYEKVFSEGKEVVLNEEEEAVKNEIGDSFELILVCEECSHQWEEIVDEGDISGLFCPMCGASRIIQM